MSRKQTKAQQILAEAQERLRVARESVANAEAQLGIANATLSAHEHAYQALERSLAPKQRTPSKPRESRKKGGQAPSLLTNQTGAQSDNAPS